MASLLAWAATASPAWIVPFTIPGGKPVTALPGLTPRLPVTTVGPVLVTVELPSTANDNAVPRPGSVAAVAPPPGKASPKNTTQASPIRIARLVHAERLLPRFAILTAFQPGFPGHRPLRAGST